MLYWSKYIYHIVVLTEIYCRFTIIDYTTWSFLSLKCVYIFLADPVCFNIKTHSLSPDKYLRCVTVAAVIVGILQEKSFWYILVIKPTRCTNSQIYFWNKTVHVLDSSSVHIQEIFTVRTAVIYVIQVLLTASE